MSKTGSVLVKNLLRTVGRNFQLRLFRTIQRDGVIRRIGDPSARLEQEIDVGRPKHAFHQHILFRRIEEIVTSDDFKVIDGHPYFDTEYAEFNALEAANEYIRHTYREGWSTSGNAGISMKRYIILALCTVMLTWAGRTAGKRKKADWKVGIQTWTFPQSYVDGDLG